MRIQHNIMAMNAYRNYNNNTSSLSKNLEKLSSGYKINRAGDDAAGLAISEKMRAQITGLDAAQKNVKDGISLVKTAEGAMQEVQDMLNRMDYLATQSANGTYDNDVDRAALQKEVTQLKSEINRIADSANFNGIKLLDGSLDPDGRRATTKTVFSGLTMANNLLGIADGKTAVDDEEGSKNSKGGIMLTGQYSGVNTGKPYESDNSVRYHKDAAVSGKTSFTVDFDGVTYSADSGTAVNGLEFALQGGDSTGLGKNNWLVTEIPAAGATTFSHLTYDVVANGEGKVTSTDVAEAIMKEIDKNDGKVYINVGSNDNEGKNGEWIEYSVTRDGDKLTFTMTDKGYADACTATNDAAKTGDYFKGTFNFTAAYNKTPSAEVQKFQNANSDKLVGNTSTCEINKGTTPADTIYAQAYIRLGNDTDAANGAAKGVNKATDFIADGKGIQIGDEYYLFAASDATYNTEYEDNVKVVDIRDLKNLSTDMSGDATKSTQFYADLETALTRLSAAAKDNEMFDVQVEGRGNIIALNERTTYTGDANLTEENRGLENQIRKFDSASSSTTVEKEAGKAMTLQIGDTADDFNQMKVAIGDLHTAAMKIDGLDIGNQDGAAAAIQTIKDAINYVSSIRGDLGAVQNRLEHTQNNLGVMAENIQDAESTIRDTDVANEMMSYVKNNILVQSAQAMLAQANQVPQGVLQLLG